MTNVRVVLVTAPSAEEADRLAHVLVTERLAACVNIVATAASVYRWQGAVHREPEQLLIIKTEQARIEALRARIVEMHPYEVPEFLVLTVEQGLHAYLDWVAAEVRRD